MNATLKGILADLYADPDLMRDLARRSGLPSRHIRLQDTPSANAQNIVVAAKAVGNGIPRLARTAAQDFPSHPWLRAYAWGRDVPEGYTDISAVWEAPREAITDGRNTLAPFEWLKEGTQVGAAVVRVDCDGRLFGSGVVVGGLWLVTNNHVIADAEAAKSARIEFGYEQSKPEFRRQRLNPDEGFVTSRELDITVCQIGDSSGPAPDYSINRIRTPQVGHYCQIIGHPAGDYKRLGVYHNRITYADTDRVQYLTDTLPGSSGSPVFDEEWNLIGIHHSGGWMKVGYENTFGYANQGTPAPKIIELMERMTL